MSKTIEKLQTEKTKIMKRIVGIDIKVKGVSNELHKLDERLKAINKKLEDKKQEKIKMARQGYRTEQKDRRRKAEKHHIDRIRRGSTKRGGGRTKSTFKKRNQRERKYRTKKFHRKRGTRILRKK